MVGVLHAGMHACIHQASGKDPCRQQQCDRALSNPCAAGCRESFFGYCRTRGGYSGVATFCRADVANPFAALDGFSGAQLFPDLPARQWITSGAVLLPFILPSKPHSSTCPCSPCKA